MLPPVRDTETEGHKERDKYTERHTQRTDSYKNKTIKLNLLYHQVLFYNNARPKVPDRLSNIQLTLNLCFFLFLSSAYLKWEEIKFLGHVQFPLSPVFLSFRV